MEDMLNVHNHNVIDLSSLFDEHIHNLCLVFYQLCLVNLKVTPSSKFTFACKSVRFRSFAVLSSGVHIAFRGTLFTYYFSAHAQISRKVLLCEGHTH